MTTLEEYLLKEDSRRGKEQKYFWYFFAAILIFVCGYMAGQYFGYHQALADFDLIKGITLSL